MKKPIVLCLAMAIAHFSGAWAHARGGHGGGHGGHGGHHGGHRGHHGAHHGGAHRHFDHHYHHSHWAHHNRPFSHGWYGRHGGRWGYGWGGWGWGNPWAVASYATAASWLGTQAVAPVVNQYGGPVFDTAPATAPPPASTPTQNATTNAKTKDNSDDDDDDEADDDAPANYTDAQKGEADALAKSKVADPAADTKFLPLGVFTLAPRDQTEASAILQLAIAHDGALRGTYYDLLNDQDFKVRGAVDKKTQKVAFRLGEQGKVLFETSLANLTHATGGIALHYENGDSRHWTLARYAKEPSEKDGDEAAPTAATTPPPAAP